MDVTKPSDIASLMQRHGLKIRKSWGQNFLIDKAVLNKLVAAIEPLKSADVLEIGPGLGVLTEPLLTAASRVTAIEIDPLLCRFLANRFRNQNNFRLIEGDALTQDYPALFPGSFILAANLPYYITSPFIAGILEQATDFTKAIFLVQWEVGRRLAARPGTKDYGALSLLAQYHCQVELLFKVSPGSFYPRPNVDSAAIRLQRRPPPKQPRDEAFMFRLVRIAFGQRRKMLKGLLAAALGLSKDSVASALIRSGLSEDIRGEKLSFLDFAVLADALEELNE